MRQSYYRPGLVTLLFPLIAGIQTLCPWPAQGETRRALPTASSTEDSDAPAQTEGRSGKSRKSDNRRNRPSTTIVIDAGHGGFDKGGIPGQRVAEKVVTLDVALRLRTVLQASGYRVVMTRDSDVFVPLPTRVAIANSYRDAIFVCIHFNSAKRAGANGIETYFYSRESLALASAIHYNVARGAPSPNRGVRRRGYYVLRKTRIPAILVECGFLTNPTEAQYAQSAAYRQKLAEEIASGVRGRSAVVGSSTATRNAIVGTVPLQPFIDQTRSYDPDISRSKRSKRKSKSAGKKPARDSDTDKTTSTRKKSSKKRSDEGNKESGSSKKKSSTKQTED
ncbi:MAG: N-acetylmuramoyl-L-alanine amidase [Verrucomicrobiota bacterium]|jgi:N-acetylmuramoyl-L-alanine amidase